MRLREDRVRLPGGLELEEFHVVEYPDWSVVYCLTESGKVVLVEQYRHGIGRSCLELPAGEIDAGEEPLDAAHRELLEETGYEAPEWHYLGRCAPNPSKQTSYAHLFVAFRGRQVGDQRLDSSEEIRVRLFDPSEVLHLANEGQIPHGIHLTAIFWTVQRGFLSGAEPFPGTVND